MPLQDKSRRTSAFCHSQNIRGDSKLKPTRSVKRVGLEMDTAALKILTEDFVTIVGSEIPAVYRQHDAGSEATRLVIGMWQRALTCVERAAELSALDPPTQQAFLRRAAIVRERIEEAEFELTAWITAEAMAESEGQTLH